MPEAIPRLSFGLPVRNGARMIRATVDSILKQDFTDFEIIISDNDSTDDTRAICEAYVRQDPRVRYFRTPEDVGQIQNFNRVFDLSTGDYFRWIGAEDTLEPTYSSKCVAALEANPDASGVTTLWEFRDRCGARSSSDFRGERLESRSRLRRLVRFLWFGTEDRLHLDPIYSMLRRSALLRTKRLQISPNTDHVLSFELITLGLFCHVPEVLACRKLPDTPESTDALVRTYHVSLRGRDRDDFGYRSAEYRSVIADHVRGRFERMCACTIIWYFRFRARPYLHIRNFQKRGTRFLRRILSSR